MISLTAESSVVLKGKFFTVGVLESIFLLIVTSQQKNPHTVMLFSTQQAILTFEDDQLDRALENLKRAQRVCYVESPARKGSELGRDEQLMRQILYADCELYMALLTFLKQGE